MRLVVFLGLLGAGSSLRLTNPPTPRRRQPPLNHETRDHTASLSIAFNLPQLACVA